MHGKIFRIGKKRQKIKSVGELSTVCSQIDLTCLYLVRFGRPLTARTNSQTFWPKVISHVMNGIICCACGSNAVLYVFEDSESVIKWEWKAEVQPSDMCQEPTELLWIGCVTGIILILKFRLDTLIPNINSQTFWPKAISHVTNGTIVFSCPTSAFSVLLAALRIPAWQAVLKRWRKDAGTKGRRNKCGEIEICSDNLSSRVPTSSSSAKGPIASKRLGILIATGKPESRMRRNSKIRRSSSQARLQDANLGGLLDTATGKPVATKGYGPFRLWNLEFSWRRSDGETGCFKKQLRRNPMHPVNQTTREVQKPKEEIFHTIYSHNSSHWSSLLDRLVENTTTLWMNWTWIWPFGP